MRYRLGLLLAVAVTVLFGLGESEAACRVGGEYRVTGPSLLGSLTLTETTSDELSSSGTVLLDLGAKQLSQLGRAPNHTLTGEYQAEPNSYGDCFLRVRVLMVRLPNGQVVERTGELHGTPAFGGSVILFESFESLFLAPGLDLNLTSASGRTPSSGRRDGSPDRAPDLLSGVSRRVRSFGNLLRHAGVLTVADGAGERCATPLLGCDAMRIAPAGAGETFGPDGVGQLRRTTQLGRDSLRRFHR